MMKSLDVTGIIVADRWIIGIDEAGRGPVLGPLIVSALAVPESDIYFLRNLGVRDSKDLRHDIRENIANKIKNKIYNEEWFCGTIICSPKRIDLNSLDSDLNQLEVELFAEAVKETYLDMEEGEIRADACDVNENRFANRLKLQLGEKWAKWDLEARHHMDSEDLVVGGASIIAKTTRDASVKEISIRSGIDCGSGYPSDQKTRNALREMLRNEIPANEIRWSWSTSKNIWKEIHGTSIPIRVRNGDSVVQSSLEDW
jgi:ribonuclease HII|tara:strand:+ start:4414 stop:5184 length:771 start_codon:yes stop_codon:yes gene_type:complete